MKLSDLLEAKLPKWEVQLEVGPHQFVTLSVNATTEEDAMKKAVALAIKQGHRNPSPATTTKITEGKFLNTKKRSAADLSAHYEKFKKMLDAGVVGVTKQQVDAIKKDADDAWNDECRAKEKHYIDTHGADWWELAKKQYPITQSGNTWVVRSKFAIDPNSGKRGPWEFDNLGQARDKVTQLVKWLSDSRDHKGHGDRDKDVQMWFDKLDAVDISKEMFK